MVTLDSAQHVAECTSWREDLRSHKAAMAQLGVQLQQSASHQHNKELLTEVEHFQNQFYIQQINIHDLKQAIKQHERKLQLETTGNAPITDGTLHQHEELFTEYQSLLHTLQDLKTDFGVFLSKS
jgi:ABC-type phosphate transport system auxiliary subunit